MPWPSRIPPDLARRFALLDEFRNPPKDQDRWVEIRDWLIKHGVDAPKGLPVEPEIKRR